MVPQPRSGTFSPNPTAQNAQTAAYSPRPAQSSAVSTGASPSASSPTATNSLTKIVVAQVYLLLSTIKEDKDDPTKTSAQLRKLIDDHGMEVFSKYFVRLIVTNAPQIFPGHHRPVANAGNYHLLLAEMRKLLQDPAQARKIAESIETGSEDVFRDFDLSSFMEHFKLDAVQKTVLSLAFKLGSRADLKAKADAILSTNFSSFVTLFSRPDGEYANLKPDFVAEILDRFIQLHPPNFNSPAKSELVFKTKARYGDDTPPPSQVLAVLDLVRLLGDKPSNSLALYMSRTGADFTHVEDRCATYLRDRPNNVQLGPEQVSIALTYAAISQTPRYRPAILVAALRRVLPPEFRWHDVVSYFDHADARISPDQFLRIYEALVPIARLDSASFDIQHLWGGEWTNTEAQLSFICAFTSLTPQQLDATTIPRLKPTFTLEDDYAQSPPTIHQEAAEAIKHPLVSAAAMSTIFNVALHSVRASQSVEAKRLFQEVVVPNLSTFVVSAFGVPEWPPMAVETLASLFDSFLHKRSLGYDFVLVSLWQKKKSWVVDQLADAHAVNPMDLSLILEHALKHQWLDDLTSLPNGLGLDLTAMAHAQGCLDLQEWTKRVAPLSYQIAQALLQFLAIKGNLEMQSQRMEGTTQQATTTTTTPPLQVRSVWGFLQALQEFMPKTPLQELMMAQRVCMQAYPRLINYGQGYDDILDESGKAGNALPRAANQKMEELYKQMYADELPVRHVVEILGRLKRSRDPLDQDVFACMMHGLFDEYSHYVDYPLEALATTAVLFGGVISHKLVSDVPLQVGLGMILEAVRDHAPDDPMYKFGLQALMQLFARLREWPGFCKQLIQVPGLQGSEAWRRADEVVRIHADEATRTRNGGNEKMAANSGGGGMEDGPDEQVPPPPFASINMDPSSTSIVYEDPTSDSQGKIQFVLNNLTETTLQSMSRELQALLEARHQQWFANHLVEARAKMQPNYHHVYVSLVQQLNDKALWAVVLSETLGSVQRMMNSEATMRNSTERSHLKNLGGWLGLITLARDKPIKHKNIAFKQLLIEAYETKRLIIAIPFVCKVLMQGSRSRVFQPPNPWLMDVIHLLIELYHHAGLKLNLKFEIEVLCKGLHLDHRSIEPSGEILLHLHRSQLAAAAGVEEGGGEVLGLDVDMDGLERFEPLALHGVGIGMPSGLSQAISMPSISDLGPSLSIPSTEVISGARLHELVRTAITRAIHDIIQPVVDRSVTIAAISTQQMIHKDFATEPDEERVRASAISMVKATAGSLALVTSKEPLRANFTNYMRSLSSEQLPQGLLPEGIIIMCVNSNLDLASSVIEKAAEERAVPEIEIMMEPELEMRRRHSVQRPDEPFFHPNLNRWAMTIPNPFKLSPSPGGLSAEQMAIYEDFAGHPRPLTATATSALGLSASDTTRSLANEVLQETASSYLPIPNIPTPSETPALPYLGGSDGLLPPPPYAVPPSGGMANGRPGPAPNPAETRALAEKVQKYLHELQRVTTEAPEEHFNDLPRSHAVLDLIDALVQTIIRAAQQTSSDEFCAYTADQIFVLLFSQIEDSLALESLVHVLETVRRIAGPVASQRIRASFHQHPPSSLLSLPLITALLPTDLLEWRMIDPAMAKVLQQRKEGSIEFLERLLDLTLVNDHPMALYTDFVLSLEEAWTWISEDPQVSGGQRFRNKVLGPLPELPDTMSAEEKAAYRRDQMEYVFEEWVHLCQIPGASDKAHSIFVQQMKAQRCVTSTEDFFIMARLAIERGVEHFEQTVRSGGSTADIYNGADALARMSAIFVRSFDEAAAEPRSSGRRWTRASFFDAILAVMVLVLNHHHVQRGPHFNQRLFFRLLSGLLHEVTHLAADQIPTADRDQILLRFAQRFLDLGPRRVPGFLFGWLGLIQHRLFLPRLLEMDKRAGWPAFTRLVRHLLEYLGDQLKACVVSHSAKDVYRATLKLMLVLQHDFVHYVAAHHVQLCESIPPHCAQLLNVLLIASPSPAPAQPLSTVRAPQTPAPTSAPAPMVPPPGGEVMKKDESASGEEAVAPAAAVESSSSSAVAAVESESEAYPNVGVEMAAIAAERSAKYLEMVGLRDVLERALEGSVVEEAVVQLTRAIIHVDVERTGYGFVPVRVNIEVVNAMLTHMGQLAVARQQRQASSEKQPLFVAGGPDAQMLWMLVCGLSPEARYYVLSGMVNQLRFASEVTQYYSQILLDIFSRDLAEPVSQDLGQQVVRVLLERLVGYWPHPGGLKATIIELVGNEKNQFFELPYIKALPEVAARFLDILQRG